MGAPWPHRPKRVLYSQEQHFGAVETFDLGFDFVAVFGGHGAGELELVFFFSHVCDCSSCCNEGFGSGGDVAVGARDQTTEEEE
jgi:hypothetical protein